MGGIDDVTVTAETGAREPMGRRAGRCGRPAFGASRLWARDVGRVWWAPGSYLGLDGWEDEILCADYTVGHRCPVAPFAPAPVHQDGPLATALRQSL